MFRCQRIKPIVAVLGLALAVGGCATSTSKKESEEAMRHENWDAAVFHYLELLAKDPDNPEYKNGLTRSRQKAAQEHFKRGRALRNMGRLAAARDEIQMAIQLDPSNEYAVQTLAEIQHDIEIVTGPGGVAELEELKRRARDAKVQPPILDPRSKEPITLNFPKPKPVKEIYTAIGKAYGFNVIFDPKLKDDKITVELNDVTSERALEIVMQSAGHFYKVLDVHSIIIADDTPQNRREYEDLVIKTFFLSNADVKDVDKLLRSLIEARRLATNEQLNAITLRDTADKVAIAERLIQVNDKAKAEVLIDVELLEIDHFNNTNLGTQLSTYTFTLGVDTAQTSPDAAAGTSFLNDLGNISGNSIFVNVPSVIINLIKTSARVTALAQPQMRVTEGEKGSLHIGDREPIPVTSFNTSIQGAPGSITPITSFQYQDIGIKIDVEPRVHHNREITLALTVEVSAITGSREGGNGQVLPVIGTRTINTVIRLQEGETNMLVGLYKEDTTAAITETPGLSAIPGLGRLFTNKKKDRRTQDIVLTLTPHILRFPDIDEEDLAPVWVGTESRISFYGSRRPRVESGRASEGPFDRNENQESGEEKERRDRGTSPYGVRRPPRPRQVTPPGGAGGTGTNLAPTGENFGGDLGDAEPPSLVDPLTGETKVTTVIDSTVPPIRLAFEPSIVSLEPGVERTLQVVAAGGPGSYRIPIGLTYDPDRVAIDGIETPAGVSVIAGTHDADTGWLWLDLAVPEGSEGPHALAALTVRALAPGPVSLVFTATGAVTAEGTAIPVAAADGALYVSQGTVVEEK